MLTGMLLGNIYKVRLLLHLTKFCRSYYHWLKIGILEFFLVSFEILPSYLPFDFVLRYYRSISAYIG